jgi:sugar phosphate isomerase/epimerase
MEKCDFSGFFKALKSGNYSGRLSFEGNAGEEPAKTLPEALKIMKSYE